MFPEHVIIAGMEHWAMHFSVEFSQINDFIRRVRVFAASAETIETIIEESRYTIVFRRIRLSPICYLEMKTAQVQSFLIYIPPMK